MQNVVLEHSNNAIVGISSGIVAFIHPTFLENIQHMGWNWDTLQGIATVVIYSAVGTIVSLGIKKIFSKPSSDENEYYGKD